MRGESRPILDEQLSFPYNTHHSLPSLDSMVKERATKCHAERPCFSSHALDHQVEEEARTRHVHDTDTDNDDHDDHEKGKRKEKEREKDEASRPLLLPTMISVDPKLLLQAGQQILSHCALPLLLPLPLLHMSCF